MRKGRILCTGIAACLTLALPLIATAQAQASSNRDNTIRNAAPLDVANSSSYVHVCDAGADALCLNDVKDSSSGGNPVNMNSGTPNYTGERWEVYQVYAGACGSDTVTLTCPFDNLTWDSDYYGDPLAEIESTTASGCVAANLSTTTPTGAVFESCDDDVSLWVEFNGSHGAALVDASQTNDVNNGHLQALTGNSDAGTQATVQNWDNGYFQGWTW
jgi:hypothetical protein